MWRIANFRITGYPVSGRFRISARILSIQDDIQLVAYTYSYCTPIFIELLIVEPKVTCHITQ